MYDAIFVNVLYSCEYLLHIVDCFLFVESFFFDDVIEELSALCVLHNEVDISLSLYDLHLGVGT